MGNGTLIVRGRGYVPATPAAKRQVEHPPLILEKPHYHTFACLRQAKPHIHTHQSLRDKKYNIAAKELKAIEPQMLYDCQHVLINNLIINQNSYASIKSNYHYGKANKTAAC